MNLYNLSQIATRRDILKSHLTANNLAMRLSQKVLYLHTMPTLLQKPRLAATARLNLATWAVPVAPLVSRPLVPGQQQQHPTIHPAPLPHTAPTIHHCQTPILLQVPCTKVVHYPQAAPGADLGPNNQLNHQTQPQLHVTPRDYWLLHPAFQ